MRVDELGTLLKRLHDADESWQTIHARVREWKNQGLVTEAFLAAAEQSHGSSIAGPTVRATGPPPPAETGCEIWVRRPGDVRVERSGDDVRSGLLVRNGGTWWCLQSGGGTMTNGGDPHYGCGGDEVRALLQPSRELGRFRWELAGETSVGGRACLQATAVRRDVVDELPFPSPFGMIHGGTVFSVAVDVERGVILRVEKMVRDQPAELLELTDVTFDAPLDDDLFRFAAPA